MPRVFAVIALAALLAAPLSAGTEPKGKIYRIGYLTLWYSTSDPAQRLALAEGLRIRGYREGDGIVFESRYAEGNIERLPELAGELVRRGVDVIVAVSTPAGLAARQATSTIPIVVAGSGDMVDSGLVTNENRPGGNVTGVQFLRRELAVRQMEILRQIAPDAMRLAYLGNPDIPSDAAFFRALDGQAQSSGATIRFIPAKFAMVEGGVEALIVGASVTQFDASKKVVRMVSQNRLPPCIQDVSSWKRVASSRISRIRPIRGVTSPSTWTRFSRAPRPAICPSSSTRATSWPSTSGSPRRSS
jgi:ABC-type uncharacterized transport system substrate-binding protein